MIIIYDYRRKNLIIIIKSQQNRGKTLRSTLVVALSWNFFVLSVSSKDVWERLYIIFYILYTIYYIYYKPARSAKVLSQDPLQPLSPSHLSRHTWAHESFGNYIFFVLIFLESPHLHTYYLNIVFTFRYF